MSYRKFACGHPPTGGRACPVCGNIDLVEDCTCGSGAHPRRCALHVGAYEAHIADLASDSDWPDAPCRSGGQRRCRTSGGRWLKIPWWLPCRQHPADEPVFGSVYLPGRPRMSGVVGYSARDCGPKMHARCRGFRTWWGALCTHDPNMASVYDAYLASPHPPADPPGAR